MLGAFGLPLVPSAARAHGRRSRRRWRACSAFRLSAKLQSRLLLHKTDAAPCALNWRPSARSVAPSADLTAIAAEHGVTERDRRRPDPADGPGVASRR